MDILTQLPIVFYKKKLVLSSIIKTKMYRIKVCNQIDINRDC